jgi:hypothetical protein
MRSSPPWRRVGLIYGVLVVFGATVAIMLSRGNVIVPRLATTATLLIGLPGVFLAWKAFRAARIEAASQTSLAKIVDDLAVALGIQWEPEARRLYESDPLRVTWQPSDPDLVESWHALTTTARGWPGSDPTDPVDWARSPAGLVGTDNRLTTALRRVPTGRLVVLGERGAGKTILLVRLLLDRLADRASGDSVPILVSLAGWDPGQQDFIDWLVTRLTVDHPALAQPAPQLVDGTNRLQALLNQRLLLLILDGFDELPETLHAEAIVKLNNFLRPGQGLVLASRLSSYRQAVISRTGPRVRLSGATGITLASLDRDTVRAYWVREEEDAGRWQPVVDQLGTATPVGQALTTPLMVSLARMIYDNLPPDGQSDKRPDPAELSKASRFPNSTAIQDHLFDGLIPAAYQLHHGSAQRSRWSGSDAERSLLFLARYLQHDRNGRTELAWWELHHATPKRFFGLVAGLVTGLMTVLVFWPLTWFAGGLMGGLGYALALGLVLGLLIGLVYGTNEDAEPPREVLPAQKLRWSGHREVPQEAAAMALLLASFGGLAVGVVAFFTIGPLAGFMLALAFGLAVWLTLGFTGAPTDPSVAADPGVVLAQDRRTFWANLLTFALGTGLGLGAFIGLGLGLGLATGREDGLTVGLTFGLASGIGLGLVGGIGGHIMSTAWGRFAVTQVWFRLCHRLPWPLMRFLEDAHKRGVLRQTGAVYQFRHVELQRRLATRPQSDIERYHSSGLSRCLLQGTSWLRRSSVR